MTSGDTFTYTTPFFDHSATFNFDDTNHIITINMVPQVDEYVPLASCDLSKNNIDSKDL